MPRIPKLREGQPIGPSLLSAGYYECEPTDADALLRRVRPLCDVSRSIERYLRQPTAMSTSTIRFNILAAHGHSVCRENGLINLDVLRGALWTGLRPMRLSFEVPLRLIVAKLKHDHPGRIAFCTTLDALFVSFPPKERGGRRRLQIRRRLMPRDNDIVLIGIE